MGKQQIRPPLLLAAAFAFCAHFFQAVPARSISDDTSQQSILEYCVRLNMEVEASYDALPRTRGEFDALNTELHDLAETLRVAKEEVDRSGTAARKEYDSKLAYYYSRLPELDEKLQLYKKMVRTYQEKSDEFDRLCKDLPIGMNYLGQGISTD